LQPAEGSVVRYIAKRTGDGWTVAFGRLNEKRDKFLINYEAIQGSTPKEFKASKLGPDRMALPKSRTSLLDRGQYRPR
jgi:hypothetical protein